MTADAGATSVEQCYVELEPGDMFYVYGGGDKWEGGLETCWSGFYCPGGKYTIVDMDVDYWGSSYEDGEVILGEFGCPADKDFSPDGATSVSQCCKAYDGVCEGAQFRIDFVYSADKVYAVSPSVYFSDWYYREEFGKNFYLIGNGSNVGFVDMFPEPRYKSDSGIRFMGWYTEPNGKGTQIAGPDGLTAKGEMPSNTLFKAATTLYAYEKTAEECRAGQYFNGTEYVECPENYYCPGVGTTPLDTPGCRVACPAGTVSSGGYSADRIEACHAPCQEGYEWNTSEFKCTGISCTLYLNDSKWVTNQQWAHPRLYVTFGDSYEFCYDYYGRPSCSKKMNVQSREDEGLGLRGYYTEQNCTGDRIIDGDGNILISVSDGGSWLPKCRGDDTNLYACNLNFCDAGISKINTGSGVALRLYTTKPSDTVLAVGYAGKVCYGELAEGAQSGAINVTKDGKTYHSVN